MANSRIRLPDLEAIVDGKGNILGFANPAGGDVYFNRLIAASNVAKAHTGTTAETAILTLTVPGGLMGPNGCFELRMLFSCTNNANNKFVGVKFNGVDYGSQNMNAQPGIQTNSLVRNRGTYNSQCFNASLSGIGTVTPGFSTVDTSKDQQLVVNLTLGNAADTVTLEGYTLEIKPSF